MKALKIRLNHEYGHGWVLSFDLDPESTGLAKMAYDKLKDSVIDLSMDKWSDKRSLQANAYFHVLANEIAKATMSSMDDVKMMLVAQYGTLARGQDGKCMAVKVPKNTDILKIYPYVRHIGTDENGLDMYLFFKRTSDLTKDEMNRLISGTIDEAANLGIETMSEREKSLLMEEWGKTQDA